MPGGCLSTLHLRGQTGFHSVAFPPTFTEALIHPAGNERKQWMEMLYMTRENKISHYLSFNWQLISHRSLLIQGFCFVLFVWFSAIIIFYFFYGQPQNPLVQKALRWLRVILSNGCFLAGTTGRVLKPEWKLFFTPASSPTFLIHCRRLPSFCQSDLRRQSDETISSERQSSSLGCVPILHYNHPLSPMQRNCGSSLWWWKLITQSHDLNFSLLEKIVLKT